MKTFSQWVKSESFILLFGTKSNRKPLTLSRLPPCGGRRRPGAYGPGAPNHNALFCFLYCKQNKLKKRNKRGRGGMHDKDRVLLESLQSFFGVGGIYKDRKDFVKYIVSSSEDLAIIIEHFDKYPLISQK
jgi:hypothetical protein